MSIKKDDRAGKNQGTPPEATPPKESVFNQPNFAKSVTSLIGNNVKVKTKKGATYEGTFTSLSSEMDVVVDLSHEVDQADPFYDRVDQGTIIFKPEDIVSISCVNVNLEEALDISQRMDFPGEFSGKGDEIWDDGHGSNPEPYDKGWNDLLRGRKGVYGNSEFPESLASFSAIYAHQEFVKGEDGGEGSYYPKPQRTTDGSMDIHPEKSSSLNPYAKPFTPMEPSDKECQVPLATVVLPTYVVSSAPTPKLDSPQMSAGGAASLLGGGSLPNQYMQYPYDYDEKLYSSYDSLPIAAHDYQQYYPHLQYIQYFRRFY